MESFDLLWDIVRSRGEFDESKFVSNELYTAPMDMRFQLFSYALAALLDICEKCPLLKDKIENFLKENILHSNESMLTILKATENQRIDMFAKARKYAAWRIRR